MVCWSVWPPSVAARDFQRLCSLDLDSLASCCFRWLTWCCCCCWAPRHLRRLRFHHLGGVGNIPVTQLRSAPRRPILTPLGPSGVLDLAMNGMQSAAAYSAAVAAQSTQAQPAPAAAHSTATPPQLQQAQLQQQAHASILRAFAPFRKPELSVAQREQQQKSRADIKNGITDAANVADADPPEDGDPDALLTEEHIQFLLNHHLRTRQSTTSTRVTDEASITLQQLNHRWWTCSRPVPILTLGVIFTPSFFLSAEDILFASPSRWPVYGVFPRSLLQQLQCRLRAGMESTCLSGTTLWRRAKCLQMVSIHPDIDRLLGGGLQQGAVTEVVASSSAGKTQFCIQAATMAAMSGKLVHVIDTSSTFEMARGQAMAQKWLEKTAKVSHATDIEGAKGNHHARMIIR